MMNRQEIDNLVKKMNVDTAIHDVNPRVQQVVVRYSNWISMFADRIFKESASSLHISTLRE